MERDLTREEIEGLEDLESNLGWQVVKEEINLHLRDLIQMSRKASDWEKHIVAEGQASILEEMRDLPQMMLKEEVNAREKEE